MAELNLGLPIIHAAFFWLPVKCRGQSRARHSGSAWMPSTGPALAQHWLCSGLHNRSADSASSCSISVLAAAFALITSVICHPEWAASCVISSRIQPNPNCFSVQARRHSSPGVSPFLHMRLCSGVPEIGPGADRGTNRNRNTPGLVLERGVLIGWSIRCFRFRQTNIF